MNFIFDLGRVLINFEPVEYLQELFHDDGLVKRINELVFLSREWVDMDLGILSYPEAREIFRRREPELRDEVYLAMDKMSDIFTPKPETIALLQIVKDAGHRLYYLSNIHVETRDFVLRKYSFFGLFDGGVFSCDVHINKPSPGIYLELLSKYGLSPHDCVFFDDMEENVAGAEKVGIRGMLYTGTDSVMSVLNNA